MPFGTYVLESQISKEERESFYGWLLTRREQYEPEYQDAFNWDGIATHFQATNEYAI